MHVGARGRLRGVRWLSGGDKESTWRDKGVEIHRTRVQKSWEPCREQTPEICLMDSLNGSEVLIITYVV